MQRWTPSFFRTPNPSPLIESPIGPSSSDGTLIIHDEQDSLVSLAYLIVPNSEDEFDENVIACYVIDPETVLLDAHMRNYEHRDMQVHFHMWFSLVIPDYVPKK
ncbi:unnamed protein product [Cuscuta epithymum]|uniref:Uncharacterized protein n=1 Tax=Cuscuta epithymum TaxID=186058 RepID=A0AAV0CAZ4_9ASTE|nr:unnamed protein product [Cuscuta epithymum]